MPQVIILIIIIINSAIYYTTGGGGGSRARVCVHFKLRARDESYATGAARGPRRRRRGVSLVRHRILDMHANIWSVFFVTIVMLLTAIIINRYSHSVRCVCILYIYIILRIIVAENGRHPPKKKK